MEFKLGKRFVGDNYPVFIVAELSCNHTQDFDLAVKTIKAIKEAGADAVKLQTYTPDTITIDSSEKYFKIQGETLWDGKTLYQLYKEAYTPWEWQPKLKKIAEDLGLVFFSSPFDNKAVDFLETMGVEVYKVASFEITDISLMEYIASKGKPVIISTGIAMFDDIKEAVLTCRKAGNNQIALLKCTSEYPASLEEININTIPNLREAFNVITGFSDHSLSIHAPVAAVALGAKILEKHFILDKKIGGPDAAFSLDAEEFKETVKAVRETEKALGKVSYELSDKVKKSRVFCRSLFVVKNMKKGDIFTGDSVRSIRPGHGLHTRHIKDILGRKAKRDIERGTPLCWDIIV